MSAFGVFLEQPLIVHPITRTFATDSTRSLRAVAARVAQLGEVSWMSLASITRWKRPG